MMAPDQPKYLFDLHNFDHGADFDRDNPPAPTFSEAELAAARDAGFADGLKKGLADGLASRDQQMIELARKMSTALETLIGGETTRATRFEQELLTLVHALYQKTFPILNAEYGLPQITTSIRDVLDSLQENAHVLIEVSPHDLEDITLRLKPWLAAHMGQVTILPQSDLESGSFRLRWQDGGAVRDTIALGEKLTASLAQFLRTPDDDTSPPAT